MSDNEAQHRAGCMNHEPHVPGEECNRMRVSGIYGLGARPFDVCAAGFCDKAARESARIGSLTGVVKEPVYGVAQQARAPGKMFSRSDILAVIRAHRGVAGNVADAEYQKLIAAFEAME